MAFYEYIESIKMVENHLKHLNSLEEEKAKALLSSFKKARQELRDRLDTLPSGTFSAQQLRGVMLQIDLLIQHIEQKLTDDLGDSAEEVSKTAISDLEKELLKFQEEFEGAVVPINLDAVLIAMETKDRLINRYESSIKSYSAGLRQQIAIGLLDAVAQEKSSAQIVMDLGKFFTGEEWRLRRIARTELHHVYNMSKTRGMVEAKKTAIPDLKRALFHPMDSRTGKDSIEAASQHLIADLDKPFRYEWKGEERIFFAPPDRPNDRAIIVPYREQWDK